MQPGNLAPHFISLSPMKTTRASLADLKPDEQNARQHNPRNVAMMAEALNRVGGARSIVIDENNIVLAGNGLVEAAGQAGIENVLIVDSDGKKLIAVKRTNLSDEQKKEMAIYDNRTAELADWNVDVLSQFYQDANLESFWNEIEQGRLFSEIGLNDTFFAQEEGAINTLIEQDKNADVIVIRLNFESVAEREVTMEWLQKLRDRYGVESSGMALLRFIQDGAKTIAG